VRENPNLRKPHNRSYAFVGFVVLCILAAAVVLGFAGFTGPGIFHQNVNWLIGLCLFGLAVGLLYMLFTIRVAMRHIREQSVSLARLEYRYRYFRPESGWQPVSSSTTSTQTTQTFTEPAPAPVFETVAVPRFSRPVSVVEGIGPKFSRRLATIGVKTLDDLRAADEAKIQEAAKPLVPTTAHQWKAMANLMILNGVNAQAAELLVRCGCESIEDLAARSPTKLHRELRKVNEASASRIHPDALHLKDVEKWVNAAKNNERRDLGVPSPSPMAMATAT
jgi:predicted flap endonuclease-1-like 5' DNA nuclease